MIQLKKDCLRHVDRCWVIGNGPSLNGIDLSKLKDEVTVGCNRLVSESGFIPTFLCCGDMALFEEYKDEILKYAYNTILVLQDHLEVPDCIPHYSVGSNRVDYFALEKYDPEFTAAYLGYSVVTDMSIPLVAYIGIKTIYLIGCDQTKGHFYNNSPGTSILDKNYKFALFAKAQELFAKEGGKIYDCTIGSMTPCFEKCDFYEVIR